MISTVSQHTIAAVVVYTRCCDCVSCNAAETWSQWLPIACTVGVPVAWQLYRDCSAWKRAFDPALEDQTKNLLKSDCVLQYDTLQG